jgi:hypothetical protein
VPALQALRPVPAGRGARPARARRLIPARLTAQLLAGAPAPDPVAAVERLLAVQAQDPRGFRLAIRARTSGLGATDVERALDCGELLVSWLNRGTLHLVRSEDYPWLHALTTPQLATGNARRLQQEGVSGPARAVRQLVRALADGLRTRAQLGEATGLAGQALVHALFAATIEGLVVRGPMVGREQGFVLVADWLPKPGRFDRDAALAELARRFLAGHGPADERDLARWAGIGLRDARAGLAAAGPQPEREPAPLPPPRLLGAFDPLLHGWVDRTPIVGDHTGIVTDNGLFRPFALVEGRAVATWRLRSGAVELEPFGRLGAGVRRALDDDAADVVRFLAA